MRREEILPLRAKPLIYGASGPVAGPALYASVTD